MVVIHIQILKNDRVLTNDYNRKRHLAAHFYFAAKTKYTLLNDSGNCYDISAFILWSSKT